MKNEHPKKTTFNTHLYKMKTFLCIPVVFLVTHLSFAQNKAASEISYTPNGIFDKVFDNDGRVYKLSDIQITKPSSYKGENATVKTTPFNAGIFDLYFEAGSGMETVGDSQHDQRRAIILQAFQDISDFINTPLKSVGNTNKVKFWIRNSTTLGLPTGAGAASSAFFSFPTYASGLGAQGLDIKGILDNEIWKTIHTGVDSYTNTVFPIVNTNDAGNFYHGWACFNFSGTVNWNLDYSKYNPATAYPLNSIDFYTTIVHEVTHALGFNSLMRYNGYSTFIFSSSLYYTRYDKYLKTSSDQSLIINSPATDGQLYNFNFNTAVSANVLYPGCGLTPPEYNGNSGAYNCPTSIKYVGSVTVPVYNPPCFENGSSLSHFEDACYNGNSNDQYFMMSERASGVFAKRTLTNEERQVLCDIGYSVQGTFGNAGNFTFKDYGVTACTGINIGGVNDGFSNGNYAYQGNSGTNITVNGILTNDFTGGSTSNLRFEFVQDIYDPNAIISGITSSSFQFKSSVPGIHILRYVPYDIVTGQRGNITYIYVNVFNNCSIDAADNLVKNGDFEEHAFAPDNSSQIYKACGWQNASYIPSCEYHNSDATSIYYGVPSNGFGNQADRINGNHGYAGMFISPYRPNFLEQVYSESIKTELASSLLPNTEYRLSFDVSLAEDFLLNGIKFQALIADSNLELTTGGIIPISNITPDKVFLTNSTFSDSTSATTWETITFTFTTGNNPDLKYLYLGGLSNIQFKNTSSSEAYFYVDNVSLTPVSGLGTPTFEDNDMVVFPNPANSIITLKNSNSIIKSIELTDLDGRVLQTLEVNKTDLELDISNYKASTYILKITTGNGSIFRKFIKNQ